MRRLCQVALLMVCSGIAAAQAQQDPWQAVEQALGRPGTLQDGVYKVSFPRTDLQVRVGKTRVEPAAALGTWAAFRRERGTVIMNGDMVLLPSEMNAALSALQSEGLEISAIHNHLAGEKPQVMYAHFFGRGDLEKLLQAFRAGLAATATPLEPAKAPGGEPPYDRKAVEQALGHTGSAKGAVLSFSIARNHPIAMHGTPIPPAMGMATIINFQPSPKGAAATGDFVLQEHEVNPVISILLRGEIAVTAVHNHMLDDEPRMVFVHFWGEGPPAQLASTLRKALNAGK